MSLRKGEKYQGEYIIKPNIVIQIIKNKFKMHKYNKECSIIITQKKKIMAKKNQ